MVRDDQTWQATTAQFYGQLYACVWQNLKPFLGASTTHELLSLSSQALHEAYPFLAQLNWSPQGLDAIEPDPGDCHGGAGPCGGWL